MNNRIISLRVKNFKCFDNSRFYEFKLDYQKNPIILSGPNGYGKTTFFDAIELILSNHITHLEKQIENKRTNLGKNLLLNQSDDDGYIILTLRSEKDNYITILTKISKTNHNIEVEKSVLYGVVKKYIETDNLDKTISNFKDWKTELENIINYRKENFNVYYYVSQAESVHFLKRAINERKNTMNVLLNTSAINNKIDKIVQLIGNNIGKKGNHIINNKINTLEDTIKIKVEHLKRLLNNETIGKNEVKENIYLELFDKNENLFFWDKPCIEETDYDYLIKAQNEIERLILFVDNMEDYNNYCFNNEIKKLIDSKAIDDYVTYKSYVFENKISVEKINNTIKEWDNKIQIYSNSTWFLQEKQKYEDYSDSKITNLKNLIPELVDYNFELIRNIVNEILHLEKSLSANQIIIKKLLETRANLKIAKKRYDEYLNLDNLKNRCPFCNTLFVSEDNLEKGFNEIEDLLNIENGKTGNLINYKQKELSKEIKKVIDIISPYLSDLQKVDIDKLIKQKQEAILFVKDLSRIKNVERLINYLKNSNLENEVDDTILSNDIKRVLMNQFCKIKNPEFHNLLNQYDFNRLKNNYKENLALFENKEIKAKLMKKNNYIKNLISNKEIAEKQKITKELNELIKRKIMLERIYKNLNDLKKIYEKEIEEYKNLALKNLRVPLLIYTGKILQDYQNGLGVFVDKDEMRFVSNGDAKHDILNTFSSGQLSGFVLAFLFAMNKQYINETDDIGFILIDDPVQTMDDINISSLIEVLRNDFLDKQIIMSTHEVDKENYILYKFYKYNQIGQSFNVKDELYGN